MKPLTHTTHIQRQSGVALFTVLILLVILASASVVLIQSQRGVVRQLSDRLAVLDATATSAAAHDRCVATLRAGLENPNATTLSGLEGQEGWREEADTNWDSNGCIFEWYGLADADLNKDWTPRARVTSRAQVAGQNYLEISEWRYPKCTTEQNCHAGGTVKVGEGAVLKVEYGTGAIDTARRPI